MKFLQIGGAEQHQHAAATAQSVGAADSFGPLPTKHSVSAAASAIGSHGRASGLGDLSEEPLRLAQDDAMVVDGNDGSD
jgi:hypothetical protein